MISSIQNEGNMKQINIKRIINSKKRGKNMYSYSSNNFESKFSDKSTKNNPINIRELSVNINKKTFPMSSNFIFVMKILKAHVYIIQTIKIGNIIWK